MSENDKIMIADIMDEAFDIGVDEYLDIKFSTEYMDIEDMDIDNQDEYQTPDYIREQAETNITAIYDCVLTPIIKHYRKTGKLPEVEIKIED